LCVIFIAQATNTALPQQASAVDDAKAEA